MNEEEIKKRFELIEKRIDVLEGKGLKSLSKIQANKSMRGIPKGVHELIENNFLNIPKTIKEIMDELKKGGYFGSIKTIDQVIRRDFSQKKKILTRIKEDNKWKYVIRK